jgi:hypothetical protein
MWPSVKSAAGCPSKQRQAVTAVTVQRYRQGSKKVKRQILDEFCEITGYSRGYARLVLRNHGRQVWLREKVVVGDVRPFNRA